MLIKPYTSMVFLFVFFQIAFLEYASLFKECSLVDFSVLTNLHKDLIQRKIFFNATKRTPVPIVSPSLLPLHSSSPAPGKK